MLFFVTGANGFVGSFFCKELLKHGHTIRALVRPGSNRRLLKEVENAIEWVEGDIMQVPLLESSLIGVDVVVHAAAVVSFHPSRQKEMYATNVQGTANVVNAALQANISKFCYVSSVAAVGAEKDGSESTEKTQWEDSEFATHYARSKYLAELEVWRGIEEGLPAYMVNPSVILGPGSWEDGSTRLFHYVFNENTFYPKGQLNYVDIRDVVQIMYQLLHTESVGQRYIVSAGAISFRDFFAEVGASFGKRAPHKPLADWMGEIGWRLAAIMSWFTKREPMITKESVRLGRRPYFYSSEKIKKTLQYTFFDRKATIEWSCQELLSKYSSKKK
ncbi:MAG: NAD-dependent epimerase/dehydratase family protein [Cytophagaceae bacterium]|jgi:nucleoside-diphosphate-sugar epimerase|nr:NAD-dependent epimerase/dehydratase family protein [Cytophagaceae bacterium]